MIMFMGIVELNKINVNYIKILIVYLLFSYIRFHEAMSNVCYLVTFAI